MNIPKKTIFSGIKPSGNLHLGNYLGAIKQWVAMQQDFNCIFCVVDYHAITVPQDPKELAERTIEIAKIYLAAGIDPKKSIIFRQSDIKEHTELAWILNCTTARMSDLENMTQYKDKAAKQENPGVGLFDYPVLMAADILLYDTDVVPVGEDQVQHVELTRDLAKRFNNKFGETFRIPKAETLKEGARIMGLENPLKKMSKSEGGDGNCIYLLDDPEKAAKKIMRATTDSGSGIKFDKANKPGISNLLNIYALLTDRKIADIEAEFVNSGYGEFKVKLAEIVKSFLTNFQKKYYNINTNAVKKILSKGGRKLQKIASSKIDNVKNKIGIL
ncbi:MAG TPA: tryptophan--tRNA ligase [Candidatus Nanoarchaeia archaeon]|nr:tryptophan--tRNA ligase [Candidatus Nanoarchaeia archaeon]